MSESTEKHNKIQDFALKAVKSIQSYGEVSSAMKPVATDELGANKSLQQLAAEVPMEAGQKKEKKEKTNAIHDIALKAVKSFQSYGEVSSAVHPVASDPLGANPSIQQIAESEDKKLEEKAKKEKAKKEKTGFFAKLKALFD